MMNFEGIKQEINLVELIVSFGYEIIGKKSYPTKGQYFLSLPGSHKIIVYHNGLSNEKSYYQNLQNNKDKGDAIDFLFNHQVVPHGDFPAAFDFLKAFEPSIELKERIAAIPETPEEEEFKPLPSYPPNGSNYAVLERHISLSTLRNPLFKGKVQNYYKKYGDAYPSVFPLTYKGEIMGQEIRNTAFRKLHDHSKKGQSLWISNNTKDFTHVAYFESPLDALSYYEIFKRDDVLYTSSVGSPSSKQLDFFAQLFLEVRKKLGGTFLLCADNDAPGRKINLNITLHILNKVGFEFMLLHNDQAKTSKLVVPENGREVLSSLAEIEGLTMEENELSYTGTEVVKDIISRLSQHFVNSIVQLEIPESNDFNEDLKNRHDT